VLVAERLVLAKTLLLWAQEPLARDILQRSSWYAVCVIAGSLWRHYPQECTVEVPEEYVGAVVDLLGKRKGVMLDLSTG
jgi:hypothetical protein